jgi:hypothetical protein
LLNDRLTCGWMQVCSRDPRMAILTYTRELFDYICRQFETTFARGFGLKLISSVQWTPEILERGGPC